MERHSLWQNSIQPIPAFSSLNQNLSCEAVVIGAGLTGTLTAWALQQQGMDVILLERDVPGCGTTGYSTGKITIQHGVSYQNLISSRGKDTAKRYLQANQSAVYAYAKLVNKLNIDCDFQLLPSYLYDYACKSTITNEVIAAHSLDICAELVHETQLPFPVASAMRLHNQACFHPMKFLNALLLNLRVFTHTTARTIQDGCVLTDHGNIQAKHIIVATRFPFFLKPGFYFSRMHQERSYALSITNAPPLDGIYVDAAKNGINFRPWRDQIILSGTGHRSGYPPFVGGYHALQLSAQRWFPGCKITAMWSAEDCMPVEFIPYIGHYQQNSYRIYVATGFQKWGMTTAMVASQIISDAILGRQNEYADLFSPHHFPSLFTFGRMLADGGISVSHLLKQAFFVPSSTLREIPVGHGGIVQWSSQKTGAYHCHDGYYYLVPTRCPHMGCQLSWNQDDLSWDCPCHGSRFSYNGVCLDSPSAKSLPCTRLKA